MVTNDDSEVSDAWSLCSCIRCRLLYAHLRFLLGQNHERPKFKVVGYGLGNSAAWTEICPVAQRGPMFSLRRGRRQAVWAGHQRSPQLMRDDAILPPTLSSDRTTAVVAVEELEETAKLLMILRDAGYRTLTEKQIQNTVG